MSEASPITEREMLERAARAVGKIDHWGKRGLTMLSNDELEAMALALVSLGLVAVRPGQDMPAVIALNGAP